MSLSSSLNAGVAGLLAQSGKLATVSDNIANSATPGYRRSDVEFSSLVNPQVGSGAFSAAGVRANAFRDVETSGTLSATSNATDLAVAGNGMLPVTQTDRLALPTEQQPFLLTPTGSFDVDENGFLSSKSGLTLLGFQLDESGVLPDGIVRDSNADLSPVRVSNFVNNAQQTSEMSLGVNLPAGLATGVGPPVEFESPIRYFDSLGRSNTLTVKYVHDPVGAPAAVPPVAPHGPNQWRLEFFDSGTAGNTLASGTPLTSVELAFDDTNRGQLLPGTGVDEASVTNGAVYDSTTGEIALDVANDLTGPGGPINLRVFIGSDDPAVTNTKSGLTQLEAQFAPTNIVRNGAQAGTLNGLEVDETGTILGVYDTGQRVPLFQVPIANVPNMNGLAAGNSQTFELTPDSGNVFLHDASSGPVGSLESSALQQSTVDVANELTELIRTQRAYSSNATVIRTADEMLQETTNLKR